MEAEKGADVGLHVVSQMQQACHVARRAGHDHEGLMGPCLDAGKTARVNAKQISVKPC